MDVKVKTLEITKCQDAINWLSTRDLPMDVSKEIARLKIEIDREYDLYAKAQKKRFDELSDEDSGKIESKKDQALFNEEDEAMLEKEVEIKGFEPVDMDKVVIKSRCSKCSKKEKEKTIPASVLVGMDPFYNWLKKKEDDEDEGEDESTSDS